MSFVWQWYVYVIKTRHLCQFFRGFPGASFQFKAEKFRKDPAVVLAAVQRKPEAERNVGPLNMSMGQYLYRYIFSGWTSINPSYFDVNYRGTTLVLTHCHMWQPHGSWWIRWIGVHRPQALRHASEDGCEVVPRVKKQQKLSETAGVPNLSISIYFDPYLSISIHL